MQEVKPTPTPYAAPVAHGDGPAGSSPIFETPIYITVARGFILFFSLVIMALSGMLMHGLVMDAYAFSLVVGLFSIIIVVWELVSEKIPSCHKAYNYWAVLSLDLLMAIFWLSSMGANAANRASFTVSVNADCYSTGAALNSGKCVVSKRGLEKRAAVATAAGLASMSAIAGLSALVMLLFIAPLVVIGHQVRKHLEAKKAAAAPNDATVEMKAQSQPMLAQQQQQQQAPAPIAPQFTGNTSYTSQTGYGQHQPQQQPYDAYAYAQAQAGHHQQAPISVPTPVPTQQHGYPQGGPTPVPQEHYQYGVPPQQPSPATPLAYPQHPQQPHYEMPHSSAAGTPTNPQELPYQQPAQR